MHTRLFWTIRINLYQNKMKVTTSKYIL